MNFLSLKFAAFFTLALFPFLFIHSKKYQQGYLLAVSYLFYAFSDFRFLGLLVLVSALMWYCGKVIDRTGKRKYLIAGIIFDLWILGIFKYFDFFTKSFAKVFGMGGGVLPIFFCQ